MIIYKYPVPVSSDVIHVEIGRGGEILCVQVQNDTPCIWVLEEPMARDSKRSFVWHTTGSDIDITGLKYIGTVQFPGLVYHLFEIL